MDNMASIPLWISVGQALAIDLEILIQLPAKESTQLHRMTHRTHNRDNFGGFRDKLVSFINILVVHGNG
jgi:hypothetical protein